MKKQLLTLLLSACALLALTQVPAEAGVDKTANVWLLSPASWHPNPNQLHENYPWDLGENADGEHSQDRLHQQDEGHDLNKQASAEYHKSAL